MQFALRYFYVMNNVIQATWCRANSHFGGMILPWLVFIRIRTYNPILTKTDNICVPLSYGYRCRIRILWLLTENIDCRTDKRRRTPLTHFHSGNKQLNSHLWQV